MPAPRHRRHLPRRLPRFVVRRALPVAASLGNRNTGIITLNDASTSTNDRAGAAEFLSSTTFRVVANGQVAATVPITFATSDAIRWLIVYEAG